MVTNTKRLEIIEAIMSGSVSTRPVDRMKVHAQRNDYANQKTSTGVRSKKLVGSTTQSNKKREQLRALRGTVGENFMDGKNPQDKGDSKRHGVPTKASVSKLRKVAKQGGRKGQLAHWMANMKAGKAKKKRNG